MTKWGLSQGDIMMVRFLQEVWGTLGNPNRFFRRLPVVEGNGITKGLVMTIVIREEEESDSANYQERIRTMVESRARARGQGEANGSGASSGHNGRGARQSPPPTNEVGRGNDRATGPASDDRTTPGAEGSASEEARKGRGAEREADRRRGISNPTGRRSPLGTPTRAPSAPASKTSLTSPSKEPAVKGRKKTKSGK